MLNHKGSAHMGYGDCFVDGDDLAIRSGMEATFKNKNGN